MALELYDRVKETTTTTGTGTITLAGAVTGFRTFGSVLADGDTTYYAIELPGSAEWEVGLGTVGGSGTTLARTAVLASSNAGAAVSFSAGTKNVFVTTPAALFSTAVATFLATPSSANLASLLSDDAFSMADAELGAIAGLTSAANKFPYFTGSGTAALADLSSAMRTFLTTPSSANFASLVSDDVFSLSDVELGAIAGLTSAADRLPYFTGSGTAALATFTTAGRNLVDDASATDQLTTLGAPGLGLANVFTEQQQIRKDQNTTTWLLFLNLDAGSTAATGMQMQAGNGGDYVNIIANGFSNYFQIASVGINQIILDFDYHTIRNGSGTEVGRWEGIVGLGIGTGAGVRAKLQVPPNASFLSAVLGATAEAATVVASAATGTINYDVGTQTLLHYTTNATANWTLNVRHSAGIALNTSMAVGDVVSVAFAAAQGSPAYYMSALTIDGNSVTPKWQGGVAPTAGNVTGTDIYHLAIHKTASATFTVYASLTKFA